MLDRLLNQQMVLMREGSSTGSGSTIGSAIGTGGMPLLLPVHSPPWDLHLYVMPQPVLTRMLLALPPYMGPDPLPSPMLSPLLDLLLMRVLPLPAT